MKIETLIAASLALLLSTTTWAQTVDETQVRELVQQEVERLLNTEGTLDAAIEKGIGAYVLKQQRLAENARVQQQLDKAKNTSGGYKTRPYFWESRRARYHHRVFRF